MATKKSNSNQATIARANVLETLPDGALPKKFDLGANHAANPVLRGASTSIRHAAPIFGDAIDLTAYANELEQKARSVQAGDLRGLEAMLTTQANTLDMIFNQFARKAASSEYLNQMQAHMSLALRAQAQCRTTVEALAEIRNPRTVFVKQANIANGPQQVNNGEVSTPLRAGARAHGNTIDQSTELLEHHHGEWLDTGTAGEAGRGNQALEAVGAVHRPEKRRR